MSGGASFGVNFVPMFSFISEYFWNVAAEGVEFTLGENSYLVVFICFFTKLAFRVFYSHRRNA